MNYTITLRIGHITKTIHTDAPLGDVSALARHTQEITDAGKIDKAAREIITQLLEYSRSSPKLPYVCDTCGGPLGEDHHTIVSEYLAGVVMCSGCLIK